MKWLLFVFGAFSMAALVAKAEDASIGSLLGEILGFFLGDEAELGSYYPPSGLGSEYPPSGQTAAGGTKPADASGDQAELGSYYPPGG